jgi:hypothetical protein
LRGLQLRPEDVELAHHADLEAGLGGAAQAVAAPEALPGHRHELALRDHVVERGRDLDGEALAVELVRPLLPDPAALAVAQLVVGRVGPEPAQERLAQDDAHVAGLGEGRQGFRVERGQKPGRGEGGPAPGYALGDVEPERGSGRTVLVARDELGIELAAGRGFSESGRLHAVRRVQEREVALERDAHGGGERERGRSGRGADGFLREHFLLRGRRLLERRLGRDRGRSLRLLGRYGGSEEE